MTPKLYAALKWGALLGGPLAIFETWSVMVTLGSQNPADFDLAWCFTTMLEAVIPLVAGLLAARATGERQSGLIAGLASGVIVAIVNIVSEIMLPGTPAGTPPPTTVDLVGSWIMARAITLGFGAWFGWLGGRLGVASRQVPP